jgi:hypothetical protein
MTERRPAAIKDGALTPRFDTIWRPRCSPTPSSRLTEVHRMLHRQHPHPKLAGLLDTPTWTLCRPDGAAECRSDRDY